MGCMTRLAGRGEDPLTVTSAALPRLLACHKWPSPMLEPDQGASPEEPDRRPGALPSPGRPAASAAILSRMQPVVRLVLVLVLVLGLLASSSMVAERLRPGARDRRRHHRGRGRARPASGRGRARGGAPGSAAGRAGWARDGAARYRTAQLVTSLSYQIRLKRAPPSRLPLPVGDVERSKRTRIIRIWYHLPQPRERLLRAAGQGARPARAGNGGPGPQGVGVYPLCLSLRGRVFHRRLAVKEVIDSSLEEELNS
jgi:hypothetical protein